MKVDIACTVNKHFVWSTIVSPAREVAYEANAGNSDLEKPYNVEVVAHRSQGTRDIVALLIRNVYFEN